MAKYMHGLRAIPQAKPPDTPPACKTCKNLLDAECDQLKTMWKWWVNCKNCRDTATATKRRKRVLDERNEGIAGNEEEGEKGKKSKTAIFGEREDFDDDDEPMGWESLSRPVLSPSSDIPVSPAPTTHESASRKYRPPLSALSRLPDITFPRDPEFYRLYSPSPMEDMSSQRALSPPPMISLSPSKERSRSPAISLSPLLPPSPSPPPEPEPTTRECTVCTESYPPQEFPSLIACSHEANVCQECFLTWLDQRMASTTWEQIACPSDGCPSIISHDDVKIYAPAETFTRFDNLSMRTFLSANPAFLHCPAPECTSGQIHDASAPGNIFRCNACGFRLCTHHTPHVPMHEDETCEVFDARVAKERAEREEEERKRSEEEEASTAVVGEMAVECPGCGSRIAKNGGCDHMTCRRPGCRFEFCYVCRAPYRGAEGIWLKGNTAHTEECLYHPAKLPNYQGTDTVARTERLDAERRLREAVETEERLRAERQERLSPEREEEEAED